MKAREFLTNLTIAFRKSRQPPLKNKESVEKLFRFQITNYNFSPLFPLFILLCSRVALVISRISQSRQRTLTLTLENCMTWAFFFCLTEFGQLFYSFRSLHYIFFSFIWCCCCCGFFFCEQFYSSCNIIPNWLIYHLSYCFSVFVYMFNQTCY